MLPQKRARLLVSNIVINIPLHEGLRLSCYDALAEVKGWSGPAANLLQRNSFAHVRTCASARSLRSRWHQDHIKLVAPPSVG